MKKLNTILLILGLVFLIWLARRIDAAQVWRELRSLGWGLAAFVLGEGVAEMIHTLGWRRCLSGPGRSLPWPLLFRMRMAGYAINYFTPTANLGGEVSRAALLTANQDGPEAVSGVLIEKVCFTLAQIIFVAVGCMLFAGRIHLPPPFLIPMIIGSVLVVGGLVAFLLLQRHGMLGGLVRWLTKRVRRSKMLETTALHLTRMDDVLQKFYRDRPRDLCLATGWHLVGFSVGMLQTWYFLHLSHLHAALPVPTLIFCLGMWFDLLTFAIPLNAGALEGGRIIAVKAVGYSAVLGLTYGVAVRISQVFWAVLGLVAYAILVAKKSEPPSRGSMAPGARRTSSAGAPFVYRSASQASDLP